jgi:sugar phosphate isomerase/epimerase
MDIGVNISRFKQRGHTSRYGENRYKMLKSQGFDCVDLGVANPTTPFFGNLEEAEAHFLDEKRLADEAGIKIWQVHGLGHRPVKDATSEGRRENLELTERILRGCNLMDCKYMVMHPIMPLGDMDRLLDDNSETYRINVEYYKEVAKLAEKYDVIACLENMPCIDFSNSTPWHVLNIVEAVDSKYLQVCLDIGHVTAYDMSHKPEDAIRLLGDKLKVLHVHDNRWGRDMHMFPQYGMINWDEVAKALKDIDFKGCFSLELDFPDGLSDELFDESFRHLVKLSRDIVKDL